MREPVEWATEAVVAILRARKRGRLGISALEDAVHKDCEEQLEKARKAVHGLTTLRVAGMDYGFVRFDTVLEILGEEQP